MPRLNKFLMHFIYPELYIMCYNINNIITEMRIIYIIISKQNKIIKINRKTKKISMIKSCRAFQTLKSFY
jgi:hypothetical protein